MFHQIRRKFVIFFSQGPEIFPFNGLGTLHFTKVTKISILQFLLKMNFDIHSSFWRSFVKTLGLNACEKTFYAIYFLLNYTGHQWLYHRTATCWFSISILHWFLICVPFFSRSGPVFEKFACLSLCKFNLFCPILCKY